MGGLPRGSSSYLPPQQPGDPLVGSVLKRVSSPRAESRLILNGCAVAGLTGSGVARAAASIFSSACARPLGLRQSASLAGPRRIRAREIAAWMMRSAKGATMAVARGTKTVARRWSSWSAGQPVQLVLRPHRLGPIYSQDEFVREPVCPDTHQGGEAERDRRPCRPPREAPTRRRIPLSNPSKRLEFHMAAIALHYTYYNFCRIHRPSKITPAMAAKTTPNKWSVEELVILLDVVQAAA